MNPLPRMELFYMLFRHHKRPKLLFVLWDIHFPVVVIILFFKQIGIVTKGKAIPSYAGVRSGMRRSGTHLISTINVFRASYWCNRNNGEHYSNDIGSRVVPNDIFVIGTTIQRGIHEIPMKNQ